MALTVEEAEDVLVGVELEADPRWVEAEVEVECYCGSPCCAGAYTDYQSGPEAFLAQIGYPEGSTTHGMEAGTDCDNVEFRSCGPTPKGKAFADAARVARMLSNEGCDFHGSTGFHFHVNCDPSKGPAVTVRSQWAAWLLLRDEFYDLCDNPLRRDGRWAREVNSPSRDHFADVTFRHIGPSLYAYQTVEYRGWDATADEDLLARRSQWVTKFLRLCEPAWSDYAPWDDEVFILSLPRPS